MIISLSGPSGIGKDFIRERLLRIYPYIEELAWFTTRPLRPNEKHSNRIHVSPPEFDKLINTDNLILVQNLYGHRYGLKKDGLLPSSRIRLTELHPDNLKQALKINPAIFAIGFVIFDLSLLYERLSVRRNAENAAEIEQRITAAKTEIETILRQKTLFASVIEITKASESLVFDQVLSILTPHLKEKGG